MTSGVVGRPSADDEPVARLLSRCTFPVAGTQVTCAVSGGADSVALLALAVAAELDVIAVHVDHAIRDGSADEADLVHHLAATWGARSRSERVQVPPGADLEARARKARRSVLPPGTLHGHTADDQAETVLLRVLRGTGPSGLAAMGPGTHPLLALRRHETVALCAQLGVTVFEDPSNRDPRFDRNRVRHEVLPLLDDVARRDVVPLLCRLAELSAEQATTIERLAETVDPTDAAALAGADRTVAVASVRRWWLRETALHHPPDRAAMTRLLEVAEGNAVSCDVVDGWRVHRSEGRLRLVRPTPSTGIVGHQ